MILIVSNQNDKETLALVKWLIYLDKPFQIVNDFTEILTCLSIEKISSIWFRKIKYQIPKTELQNFGLSEIDSLRYYTEEFYQGVEFFNINNCKRLGNASKMDLNRILTISYAKDIGLKVPYTKLVTTKVDLEFLIDKYGTVSTKPMGNVRSFISDNNEININLYTKAVEKQDLESFPNFFYPSYVQQFIPTCLEIKGLFLIDEIFCLAFKPLTNRKYGDLKLLMRNRCEFDSFSYDLPKNIKKMIKTLFRKIALNIGVFDLLLTPEGEYYFLEINPCGNFDLIEKKGNYGIYKKMAEWL